MNNRVPQRWATSIGLLASTLIAGALLACDQKAPGADAHESADLQTPPSARAYARVCVNCHLESGKGMAPAYRSLVGSAWATGPSSRAIAIVLFGVQGPVVDSAYTYHTSMLPYGSGAAMSDAEVAAAVTHVRTSWGNAASPVQAAEVAQVRAQFAGRTKGFTQAELDAMTGTPSSR